MRMPIGAFVCAAASLAVRAHAQEATRTGGPSFALSAQLGEVFSSRIGDQRGANWGLGIGLDYEWARARASATTFFGGGGQWGTFALRCDLAWLPLEGPWTPYIGAGGGLMGIGQKRPDPNPGEHIGPGYMEGLPLLSFQSGVELRRDRDVRVLAGAQLDLPWSQPYECSGNSCGTVWKVRYPVMSLVSRIVF